MFSYQGIPAFGSGMLGLYCNDEFCLLLIMPHRDMDKRIVHRYTPDERDVHGLLRLMNDGTCELVSENATVCGTYTQDLTGVCWEDGEAWKKLHVSPSQAARLSRPPMTPMSIVLISALLTIVQCIGKWLMLLFATEVSPNIVVMYSRKRLAPTPDAFRGKDVDAVKALSVSLAHAEELQRVQKQVQKV